MANTGTDPTPEALPLVSIVTPTFNMANYLPETIESVLSQDYPRIEYIVKDGGSNDESLAILERHRGRLSYFSGPDRGPSDAAWQGFRRASGEILAWVNADDTLLPGAVSTAVRYFQDHPEVDVVYGEGWWIREDGSRIERYPSLPFDARVLERDCFICQPAAFIRASAYRRCELDPATNFSFDYDLWIRMAKAGMRFAFLPVYLANSRIHSGSKTIYQRGIVYRASMGLLKRHYGYVPLQWIVGYTWFRLDGGDRFNVPVRLTFWRYLASLAVGLRYNPTAPFRFIREWSANIVDGFSRRLQAKHPAK